MSNRVVSAEKIKVKVYGIELKEISITYTDSFTLMICFVFSSCIELHKYYLENGSPSIHMNRFTLKFTISTYYINIEKTK